MLALFDFFPSYCPKCARNMPQWIGIDKSHMKDFLAHASFSCECGLQYQRVPTPSLLKAADMYGDLKRNYDPERWVEP